MKKTLFTIYILFVAVISISAQNREIDWKEVGHLIDEINTMDVVAVRKAYEEMKKMPGYDIATYEPKMRELERMGNGTPNGLPAGEKWAIELSRKKVNLRREILLSNPLLDCDKIIVQYYKIGGPAPYVMAPMIGSQSNNWSDQLSARRKGFDVQIMELSNLRGDIKKRTIYKPENKEAITDVMLHWDGSRMIFSSIDETDKWNVFEVNTDGSGLHKVIEHNEPDLHFYDATYLPDGRFIAVANVGYQGVPCVDGDNPVGNLIMYDPKTKDIRRLTFDQDANWHPRVMNNGKIMYVRWEYTDLTHYYSRIVMHANPDGTETKALYGSGSWFPNSIFDIQPLPNGTSTFVGIVSGHHGVARSGRMMIFDPTISRKEEKGIVQEIPFSKRPVVPIIKDEMVDGVWPQLIKPNPLDDNFFLVSAKLDSKSPWGIYLVDRYDNMTLIARGDDEGYMNPIIVKKRATPPIIPDRINLAKKDATFFIQDIYQGEGLPGVPVGTVKKLRIFAYEYAYPNSPSNHVAQGVQSGWDIKRLLGEVDVEEDGSVMFTAPANTPISMQPLDSEGRAIQWMRSWVTGMPGEIVSCVGCHEDQNSIAIPKRSIASLKAPKPLQVAEGGFRPFNYELEVQPILDRSCISCHNQKSDIDLRGGIYDMSAINGNSPNKASNLGDTIRVTMSYLALHPYVNRQGSEADIYVMKPYEYHASTSELIKILKRGHYGVELTDKEWRSLYAWIDLNAPFHSKFVDNKPLESTHCPSTYYDRRIELANKYGNGAGVDWRKEIHDYANYLNNKEKPMPITPNFNKQTYADVTAPKWPFSNEQAMEMVAKSTKKMSVEIAPNVSINFVYIPAGTFVMGNNERGQNNAPASRVKIDKGFWMAESELTNEQYKAIFPNHDSRYIAQFWKDHVNAGYEANRPTQPVIRVTWKEAMNYCSELSAQTGLKITLPTEAQWEWACRAGSADDMWYGKFDSDFADKENMADSQLSKMAVAGVDPKPMSVNHNGYKYFNFLLRDAKTNDGNMIVTDVKSYQPNAWGLFDMHGNVAELTRSYYAPYPYDKKATGEKRVYRGGSWIDRPKNATSYTRNDCYEWQAHNNVGFRVIIEN